MWKEKCRSRTFGVLQSHGRVRIQIDAGDTIRAIMVDRITADARQRADPAITLAVAFRKLDAVIARLDADPTVKQMYVDALQAFRATFVEFFGDPDVYHFQNDEDAFSGECEHSAGSDEAGEEAGGVLLGPARSR